MSTPRVLSLSLLAQTTLAGCSTPPANNAALDKARAEVKLAQDSTQTRALAPDELQRAGDALARATASFARNEAPAQVDQWAYVAGQRAAIAQEVTRSPPVRRCRRRGCKVERLLAEGHDGAGGVEPAGQQVRALVPQGAATTRSMSSRRLAPLFDRLGGLGSGWPDRRA